MQQASVGGPSRVGEFHLGQVLRPHQRDEEVGLAVAELQGGVEVVGDAAPVGDVHVVYIRVDPVP